MKVKTSVLLCLCIAFGYFAMAQTKVERFCKIYVYQRTEARQKVVMNLGNAIDYALKDSVEINRLLKVNDMNNDIDALNYMTSLGWHLIFNQTITIYQGGYALFQKRI